MFCWFFGLVLYAIVAKAMPKPEDSGSDSEPSDPDWPKGNGGISG